MGYGAVIRGIVIGVDASRAARVRTVARGQQGRITAPGFDIAGSTADVGAGRHYGDPATTLGTEIEYRRGGQRSTSYRIHPGDPGRMREIARATAASSARYAGAARRLADRHRSSAWPTIARMTMA